MKTLKRYRNGEKKREGEKVERGREQEVQF